MIFTSFILFFKREYERKISICINEYKERLKWLKRGTRTLFGELPVDHVCIVVDVSDSMANKMPDVRENLQALLSEQVCLLSKCVCRHFIDTIDIDKVHVQYNQVWQQGNLI